MQDKIEQDKTKTEPTKSAFLPQIAVLGSSGDIASNDEQNIAELTGKEIAQRGLILIVGGDDGVMGSAAASAKKYGGKVTAILPNDYQLQKPWLFDSIVKTGLHWGQFSDLIIRSCCGAVIIGGGAGTLNELSLLYLNQIPAAFIGQGNLAGRFANHSLDSRNLITFPLFEEPAEALNYLANTLAQINNINSEDLVEQGYEIHLQSYPFGKKGLYLESAQYFQSASAVVSQENPQWNYTRALHHDALGDHYYYHTENFLAAATQYAQALKHLKPFTNQFSFKAYLRAILIESLAFGLYDLQELELAKSLMTEASQRYQEAINCSSTEEHQYLKHSSIALKGDAYRFEAMIALEQGEANQAQIALTKAKECYETAKSHLPLWAENCSTDNYASYMNSLAVLEAKLAQLNHSKTEIS